ncbi:MAG: DUF1292 domain-containing protein [Clostridia bacterium]|nr:DUF1292 domain-containing protein [Clostridia bacterium]NCC75040.1 DUF1292 domain-containing protein [Clostridia bacterium]
MLLEELMLDDHGCAGCGSDCGDGCGHDHDHDHDHEHGNGIITMVDGETGQEYTFILADDFAFEDDHYCVLITTDEQEPEMVITRVVELEDGTEGLVSLTDDEYDRVYAEYERLCEEEDYENEDDETDN